MTQLRTLIDDAIASQLDDRLDDALRLYSEALSRKPDMPAVRQLLGRLIEYHIHLADTLQSMGRPREAIPPLQRIVKSQPGIARAHSMLGQAYLSTGSTDDAARHLRRYLELDPSDAAGAALLLAHVGAEPVPAMPTANYVTEFYGSYADTYDEHLVQSLAYRCPELILDALTRRGRRELRILDLGCGTGLCGIAVEPLASLLHGVDLSAPMLAKADEMGIYERLEEADVVEFLGRCRGGYDAIIAGGLLEHIGDPAPLFDAARRALAPDGALLITAEDNRRDSVQVNESGFFTHNETIVTDAANRAGLIVESISRVVLRKDHDKDVRGLVASLIHAS